LLNAGETAGTPLGMPPQIHKPEGVITMANTCGNRITAVGLQEAPETFINALSKAMFNIDLENPRLELWGDQNSGRTPQNWYRTLVEEYRTEGRSTASYCVLYIEKPYERFGIQAPRFYVETKWATPVEKLLKASRAFPHLIFHVEWIVRPDGPSGEYVLQNGIILEQVERTKSWYLFDNLCRPITSLLPAHLPFTLAQHAGLRFEDAIQTIDSVCQILDDPRFTQSPYQPLRNARKTGEVQKMLKALQTQMEQTARVLNFEGVFLETFVGQSIAKPQFIQLL
jgi:hypothetical protein